MFREIKKNILTADPFIYRIDPEDYISLTENLLLNKKLFNEIDKAKESVSSEKKISNIRKFSSILKRWKNNDKAEIEKMFEDFAAYRYFYKEVGASLKFNPLSDKDSGIHILEKILDLLNNYSELITPKAVYSLVDIEPDNEGLWVKETNIHFNSRKLKIFTTHSNLKSEKEISPDELVREEVVVYVVTIGSGIDDKVKSLADKGDIFDAYLLNGIGAGAAEMVANDLNLYMNDNCDRKNCSYKRLSPGYGDWPVTDQEKIFRLLHPENYIEVVLTDSHIMLPEKSTSGIMGLIKT